MVRQWLLVSLIGIVESKFADVTLNFKDSDLQDLKLIRGVLLSTERQVPEEPKRLVPLTFTRLGCRLGLDTLLTECADCVPMLVVNKWAPFLNETMATLAEVAADVIIVGIEASQNVSIKDSWTNIKGASVVLIKHEIAKETANMVDKGNAVYVSITTSYSNHQDRLTVSKMIQLTLIILLGLT